MSVKSGTIKALKATETGKPVTITASSRKYPDIKDTVTVTALPAATGVTITAQPNQNYINLNMDDTTVQLTATVLPATALQTVVWKSSNPKVVTVDDTGLATGLQVGTATITATAQDGSKKAKTFKLTVLEAPESLIIVGAKEVRGGLKTTLKAVGEPASAPQDVTWSLNVAKTVATVSSAGVVTTKPLAKGVTDAQQIVITATSKKDKTVTATHTLHVTPMTTSLSISAPDYPDPDALYVVEYDGSANKLWLVAETTPASACKDIAWSSSNESVATVDANGLVTAHAEGDAIITATATDGSKATAATLIRCVKGVESITIEGASTIAQDCSATLTAAVLPADAMQSVTWSSSNTAIATVDPATGVVTVASTAAKGATATITATHDVNRQIKKTHDITVSTAATGVTVALGQDETSSEIDLSTDKHTLALTATVEPSDASQTVLWSSDDEEIATVDQNGVVTGVGVGEATITATATDGTALSDDTTVTVVIPVTSVEITGASGVAGGYSITLSANVLPEIAPDRTVTWSIVGDSVPATIDQTGRLTAEAVTEPTDITVRATANGEPTPHLYDTHIVTILPAVTQIELVPDAVNIGLTVPTTPQLTADVRPKTASQTVAWVSSNESIATVDEDGTVTGVAVGTATIIATATDGTGISETVPVTVIQSPFQYTFVEGGISLTKYLGEETALEIPDVIAGKQVVGLAEGMFKGNTTLASVDIPKGVTVISKELFSGCTNLESVELCNFVTLIDESAFSGCVKLSEMVCYDHADR